MNKLSNRIISKMVPPPDLQPNQKLGRFVVGRCIHKCKMSHIYQANDLLGNKDIYLKLVNGNCQSAEICLEQEFRIMASRFTGCDNIINLYDIHEFGYGPGRLIGISMEYSSEGPLGDWIENNRSNVNLRRQEGKRFLAEMVDILDLTLHQGLFLSELKPDDFMLINGHLKLASLMNGLNSVDQMELNLNNPEYKVSQAFTAAKRSDLNIATIIYSLGEIAWRIFSDDARPPFEGNYEQVRAKHVFMEPPQLGIEPELEQVIRCCLSKPSVMGYQIIERLKEVLTDSQVGEVDSAKNENLKATGNKHTDEYYKKGISSYKRGNYVEAEANLQMVLSDHDDYAMALKMLTDIKLRYKQVENMLCEIKLLIETKYDRSRAEDLYDQCMLIYPDHPLLRTANAKLNINANRINRLSVAFNSSFRCRDIKSLEEIFKEMAEIDLRSEKTHQARHTINKIAIILENMENQLDMAECCHDFARSLKIQQEHEKILNNFFNDKRNLIADIKLLPGRKEQSDGQLT